MRHLRYHLFLYERAHILSVTRALFYVFAHMASVINELGSPPVT